MNRPGQNRNKIHGNVQSNKIRGAPPPKRAFSLSRIHKDTDDTARLTCGLMECVWTNGEIELNLIVHCQKHIMESQANNGPKLTCITFNCEHANNTRLPHLQHLFKQCDF